MEPVSDPEFELLLLAARPVVDRPTGERIGEILAGGVEWDELRRVGAWHGLLPLLDEALGRYGFAETFPELVSELRSRRHEVARRNLYQSSELVCILEALQADGIRALPFKGSVLAHTAYPDASLREFDDLDLFVPVARVRRAIGVLEARGFELVQGHAVASSAKGRLARRLRYAVDLLRGRDGLHVDLHWDFSRRYQSISLDSGDLTRETRTVELQGRELETFSPEAHLLLLAVHGAKHGPVPWPKLKWVRDVAGLLERGEGRGQELDAARALRLARKNGVERMLLLAVELARRSLRVPVPEPLTRALDATPTAVELASSLLQDRGGVPPQSPGLAWRMSFEYRLRERARDRAWYLLRRFFTPTRRDMRHADLPRGLWLLYYPLRLLRLTGATLRRPSRVAELSRRKWSRG